MVDLLALIFVTVLGAVSPDTEPTAVFYYRESFEDVALCEAAKESEDIKEGVAGLKAEFEARYPKDKVTIELVCRE